MATKKCIVVIGQSNADLSGDWRGWIAENRPMNLDIVGPGIGPYGSRNFTMQGTWPGYQTVGIQGITIPELKFFVSYNPSPTGYPTYPCVGRVATNSGSSTLFHLIAWHPTANALVGGSDASTVTITRKRTGTTHKVTQSVISVDAYGRPLGGATIVTPGFTDPDPETNDEFTYNIRAVENSPDASTVIGSVCWWSASAQAAAGSEGTLIVLAAGFNTGTDTITSVAHGLANGTRLWVETTGGGGTPYPTTSPAGQLDQFDYVFVVGATADTFQVSATEGGSAINITAAPSVAVQFRYFTAPAMAKLNGLKLKCTAGTNVNVERIISGVGGAIGQNLTVSVAFPATPQAGDIFEILSPTGSFETLGHWLPYCPYVARTKQWDTFTTTDGAINATSNTITAAGHQMGNGMQITVSSTGAYPSGLAASTTYYVINSDIDNGTFQVAATAIGAAIDIGASPAGVTLTWTWNTVGKYNPFPPGLDYYSHAGGCQQFFYDGVSTLNQTAWTRSSGFFAGLGYRILDYLGEEVRVFQTSIGGTTLQRQDSAQFTLATGVMSSTHIHWSPSDANGIYGLFLARLDRAKAAALEEGHTLDVQAIVFAQGESDATREEWANRYETNLRTFKAAVRDAIHSRGMTSLDEAEIPWIHPKILEGAPPNIATTAVWTYASTVNAAIDALVAEDLFMDTCEVDDLDHRTDPDDVPGHYSGESYSTLGERLFEAWLRIRERANPTPTFIVEDGTIVDDANSYATVEFADNYAFDQAAGTTWTTATLAQKQEALRLGTRDLDALFEVHFSGERTDEDQPLAWPRSYVYDRDGNAISSSVVPLAIKQCTVLAAIARRRGDVAVPEVTSSGDIASESVGVGEITKSVTYLGGKPQSAVLSMVERILRQRGLIDGGGGWGYASR